MAPRDETCLYSRYTFNTRHQKDRETPDDFAQALKALSTKCQFGSEADLLVRDQFIVGLRSKSVQSRILDEADDLTLLQVVELAILESTNSTSTSKKRIPAGDPGVVVTEKPFRCELCKDGKCECTFLSEIINF